MEVGLERQGSNGFTGNREAKDIGMVLEEAFEDGRFPGSRGSRDNDGSMRFSRCCAA